jgi:hypothetical protein
MKDLHFVFLSEQTSLRIILQAPHIHGVLVLVTGDKFIAGDNNTGEQLSPATPAINVLLVTRTRTQWMWGAAKDR